MSAFSQLEVVCRYHKLLVERSTKLHNLNVNLYSTVKQKPALIPIDVSLIIHINNIFCAGVEPIFLKRFEEALTEACAAVTKKTRWRGLVLGLGVYVPFMAYCSATVYGAVLVAYGEIEYKIVLL